MQLFLDVGTEFLDPPNPGPSRDRSAPWSTTTDPEGFFTLVLTDDEATALMDARRHREVIFKIYNTNSVILGSQSVYVSWATLHGTEVVELSADPTTVPAGGGTFFSVSGFLVQPDGTPLPTATTVSLLRKNLRTTDPVTSVTVVGDGRFLIRYLLPAGSHPGAANLSVALVAGTATAGDFCNPPSDFTVRLVPGNAAYVGRSDFDLDVDTISPLLDDATLDDLDVDEIKFLMCRTQHDSGALATLVRAHVLAGRYDLPAAALAAFSHAGIPLATNVITSLTADQIEDAIERAIADNAVPASLASNIATIKTKLAAARLNRIVPAAPDEEDTTLGAILIAGALTPGLPRAFAEAYVAHTGTAAQFWTALRTHTTLGTHVDRIQFTLQAGAITASFPKLITLLHQKRDANEFRRAAELAKYSADEWEGFLGETVGGSEVDTPPGVIGPAADKRANYAGAIAKMVEDLYPSAHLAYRVPETSITTSRANFSSFVVNNPSFSFQRTNINTFFDTASGLPVDAGQKAALKQDLLRVQRVSAITPRNGRTAASTALLEQGMASAGQIQRMGFAAFKSKFGESMDASTLRATYEKADQVASTALHRFLHSRKEMHFPLTAVINSPGCGNVEFEEIFGNLDYCACKHCDSVYGPAAYYVDILQFVRQRNAGEQTMLDELLTRRPELEHILLNCENSNTPLPTIDLVLETLERRAREWLDLDPIIYTSSAAWPQTTWSASELVAQPEHVDQDVYAELAKPTVAFFPHSLPFDLPLAEARAYYQSLGTSRVAVQDALEWFDDLDESDVFRVDERLGLSPGQGQILRGAVDPPDMAQLWGFAHEATYIDPLNAVELFLTRSGLDLPALTTLMRGRVIAEVEIDYHEPCTLKGARFVSASNPSSNGLTTGNLKRLLVFLRLQRALNWSMPDLDATLAALGTWFAGDVAVDLEKIARFVRLRERFPQLPLGEVHSWFGNLDRHVYIEGAPTYYDTVVQPRQRHAAFTALSGATTFGAHRGDLLAILQTDDAGLAAAYEATGLDDDSALNHANLSHLYRVSSLARATGLSIPDLVTITRYSQTLVDSSPFAGTANAPVRPLLDLAEAVKRSNFTVPALDWVLRNQQGDKFGASDLDVARVLIGLVTGLQQAHADHLQSMPEEQDPLARLDKLLVGPLPAGEVADAIAFIRKETDPPPANATVAGQLRDAFIPFLVVSSPAYTEFGKVFGDADSVEARAALLDTVLTAWLRQQRLEAVVVQQLSSALAMDTADVDLLLRTYNHESTKALALLTADAFFTNTFDPDSDATKVKEPWFPAAFLGQADVSGRAELYRGLRKVALVATNFRFGPGLLRWLLANLDDADVDLLDLTALPESADSSAAIYAAYAGWDWLRRAIRVRDEVLRDPATLLPLLDYLFDADPFDKSLALSQLAAAAGWDSDALAAFEAGETVTRAELKRLDAVDAFDAGFRLANRLGVHPNTVRTWAKDPAVDATAAAAIRGAAEAKFGVTAWPSVAQPMRDRLRERQRDALVDLLVFKTGTRDHEDLFGTLLMDVDIACCNRTTRLLFATGAVQLFMQRALMGLESDHDIDLSDLDAEEWEWMKRYRVWEANRKIFLYPENWVQPELRTDKTPLFKKLEEEIAQSEADDASIEKAYIHYLEGLHEVARLDVCGMYHEIEHDGIVIVDRLHVFAATHGNPFKMFYRRREDDAYWTAWEELPFQVESRGVLPMVVNRRLLLIWPKIELRAEDPPTPQQNETTKAPKKHRKIQLMWAELKNGEWSAPRTTEASLRVHETDPPAGQIEGRHPNSDIHLLSEVVGTDPRIHVAHTQIKYSVAIDGYFTYDACLDQFDAHRYEPAPALPAYGPSSLNGDYPVPQMTLSWRQGFVAHNQFGHLPSGAERFVRVPVAGSPNAGMAYSDKIIRYHVNGFRLFLPRQDALLNGRRPIVYDDPRTMLFLRAGDQQDIGDVDPDESGPSDLIDKDLGKYFNNGSAAVEASDSPTDSLAGMASGGDGPATGQTSGLGLNLSSSPTKYNLSIFYHPYSCLFLQEVRRYGVVGLLDPNVATQDEDASLRYQSASRPLDESYFDGATAVWQPVPQEDIDFRFGGAYSVYNWELFFHIPMYIADRLISERRFAEAQRWLGYIFNPIRKATLVRDTDCKHYWRIKPFRQLSSDMSIAALLELLQYTGDDAELKEQKADLSGQIAQWRKNPFKPHDVARMRPTAYMRAVVMKYLDNLIAWGDDLFRQDTRESTQEAVQLYILALQILGKRPRKIEGDERPDKTYAEAYDDLDGFSNFLVEIENEVIGFTAKDAMIPLNIKGQANLQSQHPTDFALGYVKPAGASQLLQGAPKALTSSPKPPFLLLQATIVTPTETRLYFCIPPNDKMLGYWDTVADRLFKLRNCLNIEGIRRDLALFDPPIDPGLLARAAAQGIDIGTAVSNLYAPLPHYRFLPHLGIAKDFAAQVSSLGNALLLALEKRDAENLAVLRGGHEVTLLKAVRQVKEQAIKEAEENIEALKHGRNSAVARHQYYSSREYMNRLEKAELGLSIAATVTDLIGGALVAGGGAAAAVPTFQIGISGWAGTPVVITEWGGQQVSGALGKAGLALNMIAGTVQRAAAMVSTQASYTRRKEEWNFQADLARLERDQIDVQLTAAEIRLAMARRELVNHDVQAEQSAEALETMRSKFTNAELYSWMATEISKVYHLAYQLAIDLARRAERCYRYELAVDAGDDFIQFGHWDNRRQGLLAGERLQHDLRRMEAAYYQNHRREYELTKRVSLASLDPVALIALRKTGACHFNLPSILFDLDHATHYLRRIKLVGLSIPAVTGPYTNIGATLTYESGAIRSTPGGGVDGQAGAAQSVAITVTQEDTGLFEPNLRDERYLPFEGRALERSNWRLELPKAVRQFDYETISDVILTIRYTAREGAETTATLVGDLMNAENTGLNNFKRAEADIEPVRGTGQVQLFSARAEFPEAWRSFVAAGNNEGAASLALDLSEDRFPYPQIPPGSRRIQFVAIFARWPASSTIVPGEDTFTEVDLQPASGAVIEDLAFSRYRNEQPHEDAKFNYIWHGATATGLDRDPGTWTLVMPHGWPEDHSPEDLIIVVGHKVS
ncbi:neuraminidase-like domain-containing protein [Nannocystis punicea]|uniref:Neuraminidase-like domain-containing protein n=1 Tax=Nannocystis punicea TaxID=2995304 RepID=A0ABY7H216_9BACT|nr:neuraminidase-like domain-containing protein [Nannocystis poenicansa]WAS93145.1 neuraminidase-like domain-containing protein [Nannocystis poenicansa]